MKKFSLIVSSMLLVFGLASCGGKADLDILPEPDVGGPIVPDGTPDVDVAAPDAPGISDGSLSGGESGEDENGNQDQPNLQKPGQLTVAAYDDNEHFDYWSALNSSNKDKIGSFSIYQSRYSYKNTNRIKITVPKDTPTLVSLLDKQNQFVSSMESDNRGIAYVYPKEKAQDYKIQLEYLDNTGKKVIEHKTVSEDTTFTFDGKKDDSNLLQVMFVIDTTGSMADELKYIQSEIVDTISKVAHENDNSEIQLSSMVYRDIGDEYVTRFSDFTTDIKSQQNFLNEQKASGGGDYPEAVDVALNKSLDASWNFKAKTKLIVHIADAPSHRDKVDDWKSSVDKFASKGIQIITVAGSGIEKEAEYLFRCQSLQTNGTYSYLTNESGIGDSHIEATVENRPIIEYLNSSLVRLISGYHKGEFKEPIPYTQDIQ